MSEKEVSSSKVVWIVIGVIVAAIAAIALWRFGFSPDNPKPIINGPSTVFDLPGTPGGGGNFYLTGYSDGGYQSMYWTDTFGDNVTFEGNGVQQPFHCPYPGTFTVTLTEENRAGKTGQASQSINCQG